MGTTRFWRHVKELESKVYSSPLQPFRQVTTPSPSFPKLSEGFNGAAKPFSPDVLTVLSIRGESCRVQPHGSRRHLFSQYTRQLVTLLFILETHFQRRRKQDTPRLFKRSQDLNGCDVDAGIPNFTSVRLLHASAPLSLRNDLLEHLPFLVGLLRAAVLGS